MPPRKRVVRTQAASAPREGGNEHVPPLVPPIDQDALRQMVQDAARQAAQEAVQQAVQEAARVAAQEVVRQMAAAQQGQQFPPVQAQGHQQPPIQLVPPVQVQGQQQPPIQHVPGIFQVPPPAPRVLPGQVPEVVPPVLPGQVPEVDETLMRVMRQTKTVGLETFEGTEVLERPISGSIGWLRVCRQSIVRCAFVLISQSCICVEMHWYGGMECDRCVRAT